MKFNTVTLLFIGAISINQAVKLEHHHHHKHEGHILGKANGGGGKKAHAQLDCVNDPNQATCDTQYVPTSLSDVTIAKNKQQEIGNFKNLLDQRLAEHKDEKEDPDEVPLPLERKGSNKDIEDRVGAWERHFVNHDQAPAGEEAYRSHVESQKGDQVEEMMDSKSYAQKEHHHGHHKHHHSHAQSEAAGNEDPLCTKPTSENMIKFMDQFSRTFQKADYDKAMEIAGELKVKPPKVTAWELLDKSFTFPRVRNYELVKEQMDVVEHYEDNLNTNISNNKAVLAFIENAAAAHAALKVKYPDAANGFNDPQDPINIPDSEKTM